MAIRMWRILQLFVVAYVLLVALVALFQRRLLYFPTQVSRAGAERAAAGGGLAPWSNGSSQLMGWQLLATDSAIASVLLVHGNGGYAVDRAYFARAVHAAAPVDVFIIEYPGYGARADTQAPAPPWTERAVHRSRTSVSWCGGRRPRRGAQWHPRSEHRHC